MSNGRMSWGHGEEHWQRDRNGRLIGQPSSPGGFRGRAGVVVEVAPNQFMSWKMRDSQGVVEVERELREIHESGSLAPIAFVPGIIIVSFELSGYLDAHEEQAPRPDWATETAGEIEARRALEGR